MLRQKSDVQVKFRPPIRLSRHAILTDENEGGEKDGLQRDHHRQKIERERVDRLMAVEREIDENPDCKEEDMKVDESHIAGKFSNSISDFVLQISLVRLSMPKRGQSGNILLHRTAQWVLKVFFLVF